jgi:N-methylhydantoinase A
VIVNLRVAVIGARPKFDLSLLAPQGDLSVAEASKGRRDVVFRNVVHQAETYDRLALPVGAEIHGPAVLEQADATTWIEPGFVARVDAIGNLVVTLEA